MFEGTPGREKLKPAKEKSKGKQKLKDSKRKHLKAAQVNATEEKVETPTNQQNALIKELLQRLKVAESLMDTLLIWDYLLEILNIKERSLQTVLPVLKKHTSVAISSFLEQIFKKVRHSVYYDSEEILACKGCKVRSEILQNDLLYFDSNKRHKIYI